MTDWAQKIRQGDARSLARAATGVENRDPQALGLLRELAPYGGHARVLGITGAPGAGKSTLVDALAAALRKQGKTVAVIAVDPTSRVTGGALLGDRIRMQQHHGDPGMFIRSMASRGGTGGLARATGDLTRLMDAAGKDFVIIETVGVGQDEVEIVDLAQVTVVVLVPGMGDDVQAIKAGIMEIADVFAINKADQPGADRVERELQAMLSLSERPKPAIVRTVATEGTGISELLDAVGQVSGPHGRRAQGQQRQNSALCHIDHLGIAVKNLGEAVSFYESIGLRPAHHETVEQEKVRVAMLPVGESRIELLEPSAPDSTVAKFLEKHGPGLHHVALRVPDLQAAVERLRASGARLLNEPRAGAGGHLYVFVHPASTGGVLLELIQENAQ
ncbi:MAG: methylmalonyl Co-A mutase-associated GTPase MeaB [Acidobacteriia bacterium]|nr:methylmalonyl Co-A mutase-associated GTPase MeaB [Terriglobia bacterium]